MTPYIFPGLPIKTVANMTLDWQSVIMVVEEHTGISHALMMSPTRKREVVEARHLAMALLHKAFGNKMSFETIGSKFNRDHATVSHAIVNVKNLKSADRNYQRTYSKILWQL